MDWMKIVSALLLVAMIVYLLPRAKAMIQNSPKGSRDDWKMALIPLILVGLFVLFLIKLV